MIMLLLYELRELKALITFMNLLFISARASSSSLINTNWVVAVGYGMGMKMMILGYMGNSHWLGWGSLVVHRHTGTSPLIGSMQVNLQLVGLGCRLGGETDTATTTSRAQ